MTGLAITPNTGNPEGLRGRIITENGTPSLWAWTGKEVDLSRQNRAARLLAPATVAGTITSPPSTHLLLSSSTYLQWPLTEPASFTLLIAFDFQGDPTVAANLPTLGGWWSNGGTPQGAGIFMGYTSANNTVTLRAVVSFNTGTEQTPVAVNSQLVMSYTPEEIKVPRIVELTVTAGSGAVFRDLTRGTGATPLSNINPRYLSTGRSFRLGANQGTGPTGGARFYSVEVTTPLTQAQAKANAALHQRFAASRGVTIALAP